MTPLEVIAAKRVHLARLANEGGAAANGPPCCRWSTGSAARKARRFDPC